MRTRSLILLVALILALFVAAGATAAPAAAQEGATPTPSPTPTPARTPEEMETLVQEIISRMTTPQRVGQLFLVTFVGNDTGPNSDIARLVRDWHVGGVVLLAANENFRNEGDTADQVLSLANDLQTFAFRDLNTPILTPAGALNPALPAGGAIPGLPLFIAIDHEGDSYPYTRLINGFTPIPNNLAIGATWQPAYAQQVGEIVGRELQAVGINLLLGPSLDVLDNPRPELKGYAGTRTFGGDAYWVAQMGKAYIAGVHQGSQGQVATVAKHFPGQGASDRRPDREVATVQKSLSALQQVELVPFRAVTEQATSAVTTDAMMTSHVRYKGFQENPRQLTPPISLAPELQTIMNEFSAWRTNGGLLVSDALGVNALKRYYQAYEPGRFPSRRVTQEAFLAGNDLLILSQFDRDGIWSAQLANMEDSIAFLQQKYGEDPAFRARVDQSLARILRLKLQLNPQLSWAATQRRPEVLSQALNQGAGLITQIARSANTLIFPGATELADRLPSPPLPDERVLIFTDSRPTGDCPTCPAQPSIPVTALEEIALRLYGPTASDQVRDDLIDSASFLELDTLLRQASDPGSVAAEARLSEARFVELNGLINGAQWIIFAMQDVDTEAWPSSAALRRFLDERSDLLRDKKLIVFAFNAPYFLSDTEISKLTAYYGLYSKTQPFLETAVRTLFRELTPLGILPVSVAGVNYNLNRQLEPDPSRTFPLTLLTRPTPEDPPQPISTENVKVDLDIGDTIILQAGPVLDRNGHVAPDGTQVEFRFLDQQAGVELPRRQVSTSHGFAVTQLTIERVGVLQLSASAGEGALSEVGIILTVTGEEGASLATVTPTATPTDTPTPIPTETPTPTPTPSPSPTATHTPSPTVTAPVVGSTVSRPRDQATLNIFFIAGLANLLAAGLHYLLARGDRRSPTAVVRDLLISIIGAQTAYLLFLLGWLPGNGWLYQTLGHASALVVAFGGGLLPFVVDLLRFRARPA